MKRTSKTFCAAILFACFLIVIPEPCCANPIVPSSWMYYYLLVFVFFAAFSPLIETLVITRFFLNKRVAAGYSLGELYLPIIAINLGTFIITQGLAWELSILFSNNYLTYLAEIFPVAAESLILYWYLNRKYKQELFAEPFSAKTILVITIAANILTFAMGIIAIFTFNYLEGLLG